MTKSPLSLPKHVLATQALKLMEEKNINGLFILNDQQEPIGALNMLDLVRSGIF